MKKTIKTTVVKTTHTSTEWIFQFWAWQLLFWALYRYFFAFPEWIDEFIFKPLVFVLPVFWYVMVKERRPLASIGLTKNNSINQVVLGLGIGCLLLGEGIFMNYLKHGNAVVLPSMQSDIVFVLLLSLATAFTEEVLSRGFYFSRLFEMTKRLWYSIGLSTALFMAFHIPILVTSLKFQGITLVLFFWTTLIISIANAFAYHQTKSLVVPILLHFFWNITVLFFL